MALNQSEVDDITSKFIENLAATEYASTLSLVSGGTTNLVFRGQLKQPYLRPSGMLAKTVIVKHCLPFARLNRNIPLDTTRAAVESFVLDALVSDSSTSALGHIKAPRLLRFDQTTGTQVLEDLAPTIDLKSTLVSSDSNNNVLPSVGFSIGQSLGVWLRRFHDWASAPAQAELRKHVAQNRAMRDLKHQLASNGAHKATLDFPEIFGSSMQWATQIQEASAKDLRHHMSSSSEGWGFIHGDFWTGNILVQDDEASKAMRVAEAPLFVIDWEFCQLGHCSHDIGQMIACLYERYYFNGAEGAMTAINGFLQGCGEMSDDMASKTAFRTGVHMVGWYTRRAPDSVIPPSAEKVTHWLEMGGDFVLKGLARDRDWFMATWARCLFNGR